MKPKPNQFDRCRDITGNNNSGNNNNNSTASSEFIASSRRQRSGNSFSSTTTTANILQDDTGLGGMIVEIEAAVRFLSYLLVKAQFSSELAELFRDTLTSLLCEHYDGHWYPDNPLKGSGYRCLRVNGVMNPLLKIAAELCNIPLSKFRRAFPAELTVWIDPGDVSVRIGEEGSIGAFYAAKSSSPDGTPSLFNNNQEMTTTPSSDRFSSAQGTPTPTKQQQRGSPPCSRQSPVVFPLNDSAAATIITTTPKSSRRCGILLSGRGRQTPNSTAIAYMQIQKPSAVKSSPVNLFRSEDHHQNTAASGPKSLLTLSSPIFRNSAASAVVGGQQHAGHWASGRAGHVGGGYRDLSSATCKMDYQLYANVHVGSRNFAASFVRGRGPLPAESN